MKDLKPKHWRNNLSKEEAKRTKFKNDSTVATRTPQIPPN